MKSDLYLKISITSYLLYVFVPVTRGLPDVFKAAFIGVAILFLLLHTIVDKKLSLGSTLLSIIGFVVMDYLIYYGIWRTNTAITIVNKSLMLFVFWVPLLYIRPLTYASANTMRFIRVLLESLIVIELITTFAGNIMFPMASRLLASPIDVDQNRIFQMANIGGYGFVYAMVMAIPLFIYRYRSSNSKVYLLILSLVVITIPMTFYMTAIVLGMSMIYFSYSITSKKGRVWGILVIAFVYIMWDYLLDTILTLSSYAMSDDNQIISERLENIHEYITEGSTSGDMGYRDELRNSSWESFVESPLLGNLVGSFHVLGLHSEIVDWLGGTGILGTAFIANIILRHLKKFLHSLSGLQIKQYVYIVLMCVFVFGFLNVITSAPEISSVIVLLSLIYANINFKTLSIK